MAASKVLLALALLGAACAVSAQGPYVTVYDDDQCTGTAITGMKDPFFGSQKAPSSSGSATFVRVSANNGLSNSSSPICAKKEVGLVGPCTSVFNVERSGATLFIQPWVNVDVASAPGCDVSRCQGGTLTVNTTSGAASGTFYSRSSGQPTFPFSVGCESGPNGDRLLAVSVKTPLPNLTCTLLYSVVAASGPVDDLLDAVEMAETPGM